MAIFKTFLPHRGILQISGEDRATFLQGLITNDVQKITPSWTLYAALLTPQGRFLHDFFISEQDDTYFLETEADRLPALLQKLTLYKLRSRVTLTPRPDLPVYAVWGEKLDASLETTFVDPRLPELGLRGRGEGPSVPFQIASLEKYNCHRLQLGVPEGGLDLIPEKSIPLECGLDELNAINWEKGCYMGQELTSRTKFRGLVRKRLFPVKIEGALPSFGASVFKNEKDVGSMRSSAGEYGLALLRLDSLQEPGEVTCEGATLHPFQPAWMVISD
jgi:folate-binding protein YgfZ